MRILESKTISEVLRNELARRAQRNASYSLRAFARDLSISPSRLSEVMKGKHGLSESSLDQIVRKISRRAVEQIYLRDIVLAEFARNRQVRTLAQQRADDLRDRESARQLRADEFAVVAQWYHGALLELLQIEGIDQSPAALAERLGVRESLVALALERLAKLELVERDDAGHWRPNPQPARAFSQVPSLAIRRYHQEILALHSESLHEDPMEDREFLSTILAVPRSRLPELKEELRKFQVEFWRKIADDPKDDLYSFSIQLCPVRNRRPGKAEQ